MKKQRDVKEEKRLKQIERGVDLIKQSPMFAQMWEEVWDHAESMGPTSWAYIMSSGVMRVNKDKDATPEEWAYVIAHCLLHLGLGHEKKKKHPELWNIACDCYIAQFLQELKFGKVPREFNIPIYESISSEEVLYERFVQEGVPDHLKGFSTMPGEIDFILTEEKLYYYHQPPKFDELFATGLAHAVQHAVRSAGGYEYDLGLQKKRTLAKEVKDWFISSYPLLGALASDFELVEDPIICRRLDISVAAVAVDTKEIYINSAVPLTKEELKFVMAHEFLHVGLSHAPRRQGRDPYYWNVACDYVINSWLIEMQIGDMPQIGGLYDPELKGLSAEEVYDQIVTDLRRYRKLMTLRGQGGCDMIESKSPDFWDGKVGTDLDDFYRRALSQGLVYHQAQERGYLPQGLIEEIRALSQPVIPWDVELARWFDHHFQPIEKVRTYSRPSRRQASTPTIARPRYVYQAGDEDGRTFAVIIDTSGSMGRELLGKALGTIASYSIARDVPYVRVVFCDAHAYDAGYMPPEALADRLKVKGRGGTVLQPAVTLIEQATDFPKNGPILLVTDGECDRLSIKRDHAFVMPQGARLPFIPKGEVFRMK